MSFIRSLITAFSMFSRLPVPTLTWHESNMRYMIAMFPFVGVVIGLFVWVWLWICQSLGFGVLLTAAGLTLLPIAVTGGIHLDGYCDTVDALSSRAEPARKREILKDPHCGAFAVIGVVCYIVLYVALAAELNITAETPFMLGLVYILCRALSGLSVLLLSASAGKGLLRAFRDSAEKKLSVAILLIFVLLCAAGLLYFNIIIGCAVLAVALILLVYLSFMSRRQFGGMSGDLAGYYLQICEISILASIVLLQKVV